MAPPGPSRRTASVRHRHSVVIDPGHGGVDPGNPGRFFPSGVAEKDITLAIARLLRAELARRGIDAVLTRTADTLVALADRGAFCTVACDLFVSIHVNAMPDGRRGDHASGVETYFLSGAKTEDQQRVAKMENAAIRFEVAPAAGACSRRASWCSRPRGARRSWWRPASPRTGRTARSSRRASGSTRSRAPSRTASWRTCSSSSGSWRSPPRQGASEAARGAAAGARRRRLLRLLQRDVERGALRPGSAQGGGARQHARGTVLVGARRGEGGIRGDAAPQEPLGGAGVGAAGRGPRPERRLRPGGHTAGARAAHCAQRDVARARCPGGRGVRARRGRPGRGATPARGSHRLPRPGPALARRVPGGPRRPARRRLRVCGGVVPALRGGCRRVGARPGAARRGARPGGDRARRHPDARRLPRGRLGAAPRRPRPGRGPGRGERSPRQPPRATPRACGRPGPAAPGGRRSPRRDEAGGGGRRALRRGERPGAGLDRRAAGARAAHPRACRAGRQPPGPRRRERRALPSDARRGRWSGGGRGARPRGLAAARARPRRPRGGVGLSSRRAGPGFAWRAPPRRRPVSPVRARAVSVDLRAQGARGRRGAAPGSPRLAGRRAGRPLPRVALHAGAPGGCESRLCSGRGLPGPGARIGHRGTRGAGPDFARRAACAWAARAGARSAGVRRAGRRSRSGGAAHAPRPCRAAATGRPGARRPAGAPAAPRRAAGLAVTAALPRLFGVAFHNPVLLASGTAGFGREVRRAIDLDALGGIVTKAVTPEPRRGHPAPRVAVFAGGMLNAVGLANPGLAAVRERELPWLAANLRRARVLVNVAGAAIDDYVRVIDGLTDLDVSTAFEINASCPNATAGGLEFGATTEGLRELRS